MIAFLRELRRLLQKLLKLVEGQLQVEEGKAEPDDQDELPIEGGGLLPSRNEKVLRIGQLELGTKEVQGKGNNPKVVEYHRYASKNNKVEQPDEVPWCSSFVCYVVEKSGMGSTNSMMARSWLKWGVSTKNDPRPGDIVVYWRGNKSGWKGHVGVYLRTNRNGSIVTLGGNQSDEVNVTQYSSQKLLDIRRSSKSRKFTTQDLDTLDALAHAIINGKKLAGEIQTGGKVT